MSRLQHGFPCSPLNPEDPPEQLLPVILQMLQHACRTAASCLGPSCPCAVLGVIVKHVDDWQAIRKACQLQQMVKDLPQLAIKLMLQQHRAEAVGTVMLLHRELVVSPLCQQLRSSDPATAAAGRALALQSALAVRQSGMLQELQDMCNNHAAYLGSAAANLGVWAAYLRSPNSKKALRELGHASERADTYHAKLDVLYTWLRHLALTWPNSLLAAAAAGPLAAQLLLTVPMYLRYVSCMFQVDMRLAAHPPNVKQYKDLRLSLPEPAITAEAMYMAALLLQDTSKHLQQQQQQELPQPVQQLLQQPDALAALCLSVVSLYGSSLMSLLWNYVFAIDSASNVLQEMGFGSQHGQPSSSSSSEPLCAAQQAEGLLLARADVLADGTLEQRNISPNVVSAWENMFEKVLQQQGIDAGYYNEVTGDLARLVKAAAGSPDPNGRGGRTEDHMDSNSEDNSSSGSGSSSGGGSSSGRTGCSKGQGDAGHNSEGTIDLQSEDGSEWSESSGEYCSSSASSSSGGGWEPIPTDECVLALTAAAHVLLQVAAGGTFHFCGQQQQQQEPQFRGVQVQLTQQQQQQQLAELPMLLLCAAAAQLRLPKQSSLQLVTAAVDFARQAYCYSSKIAYTYTWCPIANKDSGYSVLQNAKICRTANFTHAERDETTECEGCGRLLQKHSWHCLGFLTMISQQLLVLATKGASAAATVGTSESGKVRPDATGATQAGAASAAIKSGDDSGSVQSLLHVCLQLQMQLLCASVHSLPQDSPATAQLEQAAFALQVTEAVVRHLGAAAAAEVRPDQGSAAAAAACMFEESAAADAAAAADTPDTEDDGDITLGQVFAGACVAAIHAAHVLFSLRSPSSSSSSSGSGSCAAAADSIQWQQLLQALCSLLLSCSKMQQVSQQPASVEGLACAVHLVDLLCQTAAAACTQQGAETAQPLSSSSSSSGVQLPVGCAAPAWFMLGRYLECMSNQLQEDSVPSTFNTPSWLPPMRGQQQEQQQQKKKQQQEQQQQLASKPPSAPCSARCDHLVSVLEAVRQLLDDWGPSLGASAERLHLNPAGGTIRPKLQGSATVKAARDGVSSALDLGVKQLQQVRAGVDRALKEPVHEQTVLAQQLRNRADSAFRALKAGLHTAAEALTLLAPSCCCNNPTCTNLRSVSEVFGLVRGQGCICGGCQLARYCSRQCQATHWPNHKQFCQYTHKHDAAAAGIQGAVSTAAAAALVSPPAATGSGCQQSATSSALPNAAECSKLLSGSGSGSTAHSTDKASQGCSMM